MIKKKKMKIQIKKKKKKKKKILKTKIIWKKWNMRNL